MPGIRVVLNILSICVEHIGTVPSARNWPGEEKLDQHQGLGGKGRVVTEEGDIHRRMFTAFQLASVLQHCVHHVSGPRSLSMCWGYIQEVLHVEISTHRPCKTLFIAHRKV